MSIAWAKLAGALRYGYTLRWILRIEGIPVLFMESTRDAIAPAGYTLDASLVVDRSARIGTLMGEKGFPKAFDFEARLLPTATVAGLMRRPTRMTTLAAALTASATTLDVRDPGGWTSPVFVGASCIPFASTTTTGFAGCSRTSYGRARSYAAEAIVADVPYVWTGRHAELWAVVTDPTGRYVQGADILERASCLWEGDISERPERDGTEWVIAIRDIARRPSDPIGVSASGQAVWSADDDPALNQSRALTLDARVSLRATGVVLAVSVAPFPTPVSQPRASRLRQKIVDALTAASTNPAVVGFRWNRLPTADSDLVRAYTLMVTLTTAAGDSSYQSSCTIRPSRDLRNGAFLGTGTVTQACAASSTIEVPLNLFQYVDIRSASLGVTLDSGDPADLPTTGRIVLEGEGTVDYATYTGRTVDAAGTRVDLELEAADRYTGEAARRVLTDGADMSVRFLWSSSGPLKDVLRQALTSTGDGVHGTYDTLAKGQGLGIPHIDEASFERVFSGVFNDFNWDYAVDSGTSLDKVFGGLFQLSRRGLAARRAADGSSVQIAAVDVGSLDNGAPTAVIRDRDLVSLRGKRPVRPKATYQAPQQIHVKCKTLAAGDLAAAESTINFRDPHLTDWTSIAWELELYGLPREAISQLGEAWALSWFRAGETRQIIEIDLPPWIDCQVGDVVRLSLLDPSAWDYAEGASGYDGLALVMGSQLDMSTAVQTVTVAVGGALSAGPMCPSLPIVAVAGGATTPTSLDVDEALYDLLVAARAGQSTWWALAYQPGRDAGLGLYQLGAVTRPGGGVARIAVVQYPTVPSMSLTTACRLSWAPQDLGTEVTDRYLHNTDGVQWV